MVSTCLTRRKSCSYSTTSKPPTLTTKPSTSSALAVSEILLSRFLNSQKSYSPSNQIYLTRSPSNSTEELKLKYIIANVDENLKLFIRLLAPYFLNTASHKVFEYLIWVNEIHAFHNHLLIYSFLHFFETSFFLRMIQLLNIKQDEMMYFRSLSHNQKMPSIRSLWSKALPEIMVLSSPSMPSIASTLAPFSWASVIMSRIACTGISSEPC